MISYGYRMVNLLKPHWSLHAHCCYCPVMEATGECTMGNNQRLFVCLYMCLTCTHTGIHVTMDMSNYLSVTWMLTFACFIIPMSHYNPGSSGAVSKCCSCIMATVPFSCCHCGVFLLFKTLRFVLVCRFFRYISINLPLSCPQMFTKTNVTVLL